MTNAPSQPLVSVIVPAFNAAATLLETLESISAQTYANMEIIIVDDGSTDETPQIAKDYCAEESRARLISKANGGVASARNRGIEEARGEWVAPIDADDLWHPTKIEKQVRAALGAVESPGFVYCWHNTIDEQGLVVGSSLQVDISGLAFQRIAYWNPVGNGSALLIQRQAAIAAGGYDPALRAAGNEGCEDLLLELMIARHHPVALVPEHLVGYRRHGGSMSRDQEKIIRSWQLTFERVQQEQPRIAPHVLRWSNAFLARTLAEDRYLAGSNAQAFALVLRALRLDPVRWGSYLLYRLARTAVRLARGRRPRPQPRHFLKIDPREFVPYDPDELAWLAGLYWKIDARRLSRLAARERT